MDFARAFGGGDLRDRSQGVLLAFAHTTTSPIGFYALPRALDRRIFVPNERGCSDPAVTVDHEPAQRRPTSGDRGH